MAITICTPLCAESAAPNPPIRVVILSGANNHDWRQTTPLLEKIFNQCERFAVTSVVEDPNEFNEGVLKECDAVVSNWTVHPDMTCDEWGTTARETFIEFIRSGKGFVLLHAASTSCHDWPEFQRLSGLTWRLGHTGHSAYHIFKVSIAEKDHPIARGMRDFWIRDELYHEMANLTQLELEVLCTAFSASYLGGSGQFEPVLLTTRLGRGRGVNLVLGHDVATMRNVGWRHLMLCSTEWAAGGEMSLPTPDDWPDTATAVHVEGVEADSALQAVLTYKAGQSREPLFVVEQLVCHACSGTGPDAAAKRYELAEKIAKCLVSNATPDTKRFLCNQLAMIGTDAQVPLLASLLVDEQVSPSACHALECIPGSKADEALLGALSNVTGERRIRIINSLGNRGDDHAVTALSVLLSDTDLAGPAAAALGRIGGDEAAEALGAVVSKTIGEVHLSVADAYLTCAERFLSNGNKQRAIEIYRRLYGRQGPALIRIAALRGLMSADASHAQRVLSEIMAGNDAELKHLVADLAPTTSGIVRDNLTARYTWKQTGCSLALLNRDRVVWEFHYAKDKGKPCFHPLALTDGTVLTDLNPPDHVWHRALWFSWKNLNDVNYWEEDATTGLSPGRTTVTKITVSPNDDFSAQIAMTLSYHPPDQPIVLTEDRTLTVSAPSEDGSYIIGWHSAFTAGAEDVELRGGTAGGGYAGLSVRMARATRDWRIVDSEGRQDRPDGPFARNTHGHRARWVDFSLTSQATGSTGGIAVLDHPENLRYPSYWHNLIDEKAQFGYFSPAPLWRKPYVLAAGSRIMLRYRVIVHPGRPDRQHLDNEWKTFAEGRD
jgi:type 1 glutamine amidotransferase